MKIRLVSAIMLALTELMFRPNVTLAAEVTYAFTGTIRFSPIPEFSTGWHVQGLFKFSDDATDLLPADAQQGFYRNDPLKLIELSIPDAGIFLSKESDTGVVQIIDGLFGGSDRFEFHGALGEIIGAGFLDGVSLLLNDEEGTVFSNDAFPTIVPDLSAFELREISIRVINSDGGHSIIADLESLTQVNEPAAVLILASLALSMGWVRRRATGRVSERQLTRAPFSGACRRSTATAASTRT
jgi:hypothetical protein